jgi:hypothetical protein
MAEVRRIVPNRRWYPQDLASQAIWWANFSTQFAIVGPGLGFAAGVVPGVQDDNTVMQFVATTVDQGKAFEKAIRTYKEIITEFPVGEPTPAFPANPTFALPEVIPTGLNQRLIELRERILVAPTYTDETGVLLGILPSGSEAVPESELKPTIKAFESIGQYKFDVRVIREGMPAYKIQFARADEATVWTDVAFSTTRLITVTITPYHTRPTRTHTRPSHPD